MTRRICTDKHDKYIKLINDFHRNLGENIIPDSAYYFMNTDLDGIEGEIWKDLVLDARYGDIHQCKGVYQISNYGRIKSLARMGRNKRQLPEMIIKQHPNKKKCYLEMTLTLRAKEISVRPHRLVALAFLENLYNLDEVDHINHIRTDNRLCNLRWRSRSDNMDDITTKRIGESKSKPVVCMTSGLSFHSIEEAASFYNMSASHIPTVCNGKRLYSGTDTNGNKLYWKYITEDEYERYKNHIRIFRNTDIPTRIINVSMNRTDKHIKYGISLDSKQVKCTTTGKVFPTIKKASKFYGVSPSRISGVCTHKVEHVTAGIYKGEALKWEYITFDEYVKTIENFKYIK